jgi:hypothetical protein
MKWKIMLSLHVSPRQPSTLRLALLPASSGVLKLSNECACAKETKDLVHRIIRPYHIMLLD